MKRFSVALIIILIPLLAWFWGRPAYRARKERVFAEQAQADLAKGDPRAALLSARQVLMLNSNNLAATRVMADLAEQSGSPHALSWRKRVAELDPTIDNKLLLAAMALRHEQPPFVLASQTLREIEPTASNQVTFQALSAHFALKQNRVPDAERHFTEAIRLEPTNNLHRVNLAVVRLRSTNDLVSAQAQAELESLAESDAWGDHARRALVSHHVGKREFNRAYDFSSLLLRHPRVTFGDRLEHLSVLRAAQHPDFKSHLETLQASASTNSFMAGELANRMIAFGEPRPAKEWIESLPPAIRAEFPLPQVIANSFAADRDWLGMEQYLNAQATWKEQEFLRLALLAFAVRNQNDAPTAEVHWSKAVQAAERPELLARLAQMAFGWGWNAEGESVLWRAAKQSPGERWPLELLEQIYNRQSNTRGLYTVNEARLERSPANPEFQNNVAALGMLLSTNMARAHQLAEQVYRVDPRHFAYASTYAWSVYLKGDSAEALRVIENIEASRLNSPILAPYYGALLAAAGQKEKARAVLARVEGQRFLPEENALVADVKKKL